MRFVSEPLVPREEARAALEARAELGPAYDAELAERFAEELERRLSDRAAKPVKADSNQRTAIVIVSLVASIPLLGIAGSTVWLGGVVAVCVALALVNYFAWRD